jgi:hypothetical protein
VKGFPNQVADLTKIATAINDLANLVDAGANARNDGVFGEALVRSGVAGTGHRPMPIEEYLAEQRLNTPSNQSFRTTARGLRQLFRLMELIDDSGQQVIITDSGRQAAAFAGLPLDAEQVEFWRRTIQNMSHDGSHPYQVLLGLVGQRPGITRKLCALALEAENDSPEELARIVGLADLPEAAIRDRIGVTKSNWDNAKKVLPKFAEQLGDVIKRGDQFWLADAPGRDDAGAVEDDPAPTQQAEAPRVRAPRTSRSVTPETIGRAGTAERSAEFTIPPDLDPNAVAEANRLRQDRLRRHNLLVQELAGRLNGLRLFEDPFDILALAEALAILIEVKTLSGTEADERDRVRGALGQLLYYEKFVTTPVAGEAAIHKVACFEGPISDAHREFLNEKGIAVIWKIDGGFAGDELAADILGAYIQELA